MWTEIPIPLYNLNHIYCLYDAPDTPEPSHLLSLLYSRLHSQLPKNAYPYIYERLNFHINGIANLAANGSSIRSLYVRLVPRKK